MKALNISGLVSLGITPGDTTPNPGYPAVAWSTVVAGVVWWNGTSWQHHPWDAQVFYPGVPTASAFALRIASARTVRFPANFTNSLAIASVAATASTVFQITKNGASIGTITFGTGATTGTFASSGGTAQSIASGDILAIQAPASPDATLANIGITLTGTR